MNIHYYQGNISCLEEDCNADKAIDIIKAKISEFFNMKNVNFLFGSGTSCPAIPDMAKLYQKVESTIPLETPQKELFDLVKSSEHNLEAILGVLYSQRAYLEGINTINETLVTCTKLITHIEDIIFNEINIFFDKKIVFEKILYEFDLKGLYYFPNVDNYCMEKLYEVSTNYYNYYKFLIQKNLKSNCFHLPRMSNLIQHVLNNYIDFYQKVAFRNKDLARISVFTTNNDLFNETALDMLNIHYINGFGGGINKYFNPALFNYTFSKRMDTSIEKYEPVENVVYLYKIHGSINWEESSGELNRYFNIKESAGNLQKTDKNVLIYPTPTKQNKSLGSPYVDLFREFQHKLLEPNNVLFVIGYSFSDEHVNDIIYRALATNSSLNVVILNDVRGKPINEIKDSRIFKIYGTKGNNKKIHFFDYIVTHLIPDQNTDSKKHDDLLKQFIEQIKNDK